MLKMILDYQEGNKMLEINEIIDNSFMDKDVSELIKDGLYLFACIEDTLYFYYKGKVFGTFHDNASYNEFTSKPYKYTKGTLRELYGELQAQKVVLKY